MCSNYPYPGINLEYKIEHLSSYTQVVHTTTKQIISRRGKNENVCEMFKNDKCTCKACRTIVFHRQICKFLWRSCCRPRRSCLSYLLCTTEGSFLEIPEKPFIKLRAAYSVKLVFSYVVKGIKIKITAKSRASRPLRYPFVLKIQRELCHPKCARKVSGLSRNGPQPRLLSPRMMCWTN